MTTLIPDRILAAIFYTVAVLCAVISVGLDGPGGIKAMGAAILFALVGGVCSISAAIGDMRLTLALRLADAPTVETPRPPEVPAAPEPPKARAYVRPPWEKPPTGQ